MTAPDTHGSPRVVMVVTNGIVGDSRVQKVAWSAAVEGFVTTLVGVSPDSSRREHSLAGARVVRVPVPPPRHLRRLHRGLMRRAYRLATPREGSVGARPARMAARLVNAVVGRRGGWRVGVPQARDRVEAMVPEVVAADPDIIHAHDYTALPVALEAAAEMERHGRRSRLVYDAHEYLRGVRGHDIAWRRAYEDLEARALAVADATVTVSGPLADLLTADHALARRPVVVANPPVVQESHRGHGKRLRETVGVPAATPLLVYSGALAPQRGVSTLVQALRLLPGVHIALVVPEANRFVKPLISEAHSLGVADRVHVTGYVPAAAVPWFLSDATAGVIPLLHYQNHEIALITKWYEYAYARLPILVSDVREMADTTRRLGVGEVFRAGDPEALAAAARGILDDRDRYVAGYTEALLSSWRWQHEAGKLIDLYVELVGRRPTPVPLPPPFPVGGLS